MAPVPATTSTAPVPPSPAPPSTGAVGPPGGTTAAPAAPGTGTDPAPALEVVVRPYGPAHASSGVVDTAAGAVAAVSYNVATPAAGTNPHVAVYSFTSGAWSKVADITLDVGGQVLPAPSTETPVTVVHLTGSVSPDFAVTVNYNDGPAAAIISQVGGTWHALTFSGGHHGGDEIVNPTFAAGSVSERFNTCTPDCAAGTFVTTTYRYSAGTGQMAATP